MDEDTDHSLRQDYLSATLLQGHPHAAHKNHLQHSAAAHNSNPAALFNASSTSSSSSSVGSGAGPNGITSHNSAYSVESNSPTAHMMRHTTSAVTNLQIHSQDEQEKASWDKLDSIHSKTSTVATHTTMQHGDHSLDEMLNDSSSSFASFGGDESLHEDSSLSMSYSQDFLSEERAHFKQSVLEDDLPSSKRSLLDSVSSFKGTSLSIVEETTKSTATGRMKGALENKKLTAL
jgi:hypothetical protein